MLKNHPIPNSFLENINMVNTATNFFNSNKDISDINSLYNKTTNGFSPFNTSNNYKLNTLNLNNQEYNKLTQKKSFLWKEINNLNFNELDNDEKILENPVIKNILNSDINENEIQNLPENYLVNLIHTLQSLANNAIKNKNYLELENKQLYHDLESIKTNNEYLHQKNIKINQKLIKLNRQKNEEKKEQNEIYNLLEGNNTLIKRKKYYCEICTNKKFKSQKYLDEHILRRHPDYYQKNLKQKNKKENKINIELYTKKLNDMKNYFDNLIYKSIKKIQYIKISEKINCLQNLYEMSKLYNNNINIINNNININNSSSNQEEINIENNIEVNNNNNNFIEEKIKEKKSETENNSNGLEKSEETPKKKQNEIMEKRYRNFKHDSLILKKKIKFIQIKENFYSIPEEQTTQQRSKKKRKTQKNRSKLVPDSSEEQTKEEVKKLEFNEEKIDKKEEPEILKGKNEDKKKEESNEEKKEKEKEDEIDNNKRNEDQESIKSSKQKINLKLKEENMINFSDEEKEKNQILKQFRLDFKKRDSNLSKLQEKYYLKKVLPKDYDLDKNKVEGIIKEKINVKLKKYNFKEKSIPQMKSEMMNIYYETVDFKEKYGDMYLYSYINISNFMNLQDLIFDANNNNVFLEESFFEKVNYKLESENNSEYNDYSFDNEDKQNDFSFKAN